MDIKLKLYVMLRNRRGLCLGGRLGLTNYLMQTIICMLLFYPFGLKLIGKLTLLQSLLLAVLIFIVQIIYSNIWLRYYNIGPMEAIWRRFTNGKQPDPATALQ
jgi:uncharacterized protein